MRAYLRPLARAAARAPAARPFSDRARATAVKAFSPPRIEPAEPIDPSRVVREDERFFYVEDEREPFSVFEHEAGVEGAGVFAVVSMSGTQFKVRPDDVLVVDRLPIEVNREYQMEQVLLVGSARFTAVGRPTIPGASVLAVCEEHVLTEKERAFKMKRRKRYMRTVGFRRPFSLLRVKAIRVPEAISAQFS